MSAYLSAREAADYCGVSEKTVRNWIAAGRLSAERSAGAFRIAQEDLEALRRENPRSPQGVEGAGSAPADVRAESPRTESAPGLVDLVALLREREAKIDALGVQLVQYAESAAMWQARAAVFAHQLETAHGELQALRAPQPEPAPDPFPEPIPPAPNAAPWDARWQMRATIAAGVLAMLAVAALLAPGWVR